METEGRGNKGQGGGEEEEEQVGINRWTKEMVIQKRGKFSASIG